jgi:hypothetical protein
MRVAAGVLGLALVLLVLAEFFVAFLLPRRVKRDPRLARRFLLIVWRPWRALATRMSASTADTALGIFGPFGLLAMLGLWSAGLILGFAGMYWSIHPHFDAGEAASFGDDLYFSASAFFSASTIFDPEGGVAWFLQIAEAACGFGVLFIAIGYLPALFQAFSTRETAVSQLDPRAGSPPTAGTLPERSAERGGWEELDEYLGEWETWAAELMETHLSYPILGYFRSQHVNQNWLAALMTVVDTSAFAIAYAPDGAVNAAGFTFAIGRHALADLAHSYRAPTSTDAGERLPADRLAELCRKLQEEGLELRGSDEAAAKLGKLRGSYERYAVAIARQLALPLPGWLPGEDSKEYWRGASAYKRLDWKAH